MFIMKVFILTKTVVAYIIKICKACLVVFLPNGSCLRRTSFSLRRFLLVLKKYPVPAALTICTRMVLVDRSIRGELERSSLYLQVTWYCYDGTEPFLFNPLTLISLWPLGNGREPWHELEPFRWSWKIKSSVICRRTDSLFWQRTVSHDMSEIQSFSGAQSWWSVREENSTCVREHLTTVSVTSLPCWSSVLFAWLRKSSASW